MKDKSEIEQGIIIRFILAYAGCLLIGYIFFQDGIFIPKNWPFQFVVSGALGAIFLAFLQTISLRSSWAVFVVLSILSQAITNQHLELSLLLRDILALAALGFGIFLFWKFSLSDKNIIWHRPLQLAGFLAVLYVIATSSLLLYHNAGDMYVQTVFIQLSVSFLIGLGLGIGTEAANLYLKRIETTDTSHLENQ
jgi:hypothetical protein